MNTKTFLKSMLAATVMISGGTFAADWLTAGTVGDRLAVYVDSGSWQSNGGGVARVEAMEDFGRTLFLNGESQGHQSRSSTLVVDCGTRRVGFDAWRLHEGARGEGRVVAHWESQGLVAMFQPAAGSSQARVLARTCGGAAVAAVR